MPSLIDALANENTLTEAAKDYCALIDDEVEKKSGLSGMAIKAGYKTVNSVKPGFIEKVVKDLLPEFARALAPLESEAQAKGQPVSSYFPANASRVADALLAITDQKAERSQNKVVKGAYGKLRGMAKSHVEAAVPGLAVLAQKHSA
ncbi:MAG: hypothetical protein H5U40_04490 [Polyangiaceae bacterium]|nr:hypothetical protein [Polyangiaceae bacterium]